MGRFAARNQGHIVQSLGEFEAAEEVVVAHTLFGGIGVVTEFLDISFQHSAPGTELFDNVLLLKSDAFQEFPNCATIARGLCPDETGGSNEANGKKFEVIETCLISHLKGNSDHRHGVDGMPICAGRTEADLCGGVDGLLLQSIAEAAHYPQDTEISGAGEENLQHDVALEVCPARLFRVGGARLE